MNKKISVNLALAFAILAMTVTFSVTMILSQNMFNSTVASVQQKEMQYDKLSEIDVAVRDDAYYPIDDAFLSNMLGAGYIAGISDENARYYTAAQYVTYLNEESGVNVGIGVDFVKEDAEYPVVVRAYQNSPAAALGITTGFTLIEIDGNDLKNLSQSAINALLRGTDGSSMVLVYSDLQGKDSAETTIQRNQYNKPTIEVLQNANEVIGYINILTFNANTKNEVDVAIEGMMQSPQGLLGLVIDLRENEGGSLDYALDTLDALCPAGPLGYSLSKDGTVEVLETSDNANTSEVPIAVIVNETTAAGAELFAAGIRDLGVGQIVGTVTAGKGSIQCAPIRLSDGSAISYTVGLLLTGKSEQFDAVGIVPDVTAVLRDDEIEDFYTLPPMFDTQAATGKEVVMRLANITSSTVEQTDTAQENVELTEVDQENTAATDGEQSAEATE